MSILPTMPIVLMGKKLLSTFRIKTLRKEFPEVPFIGMEPAVKPAVLGTKTGVIGVLATAGTLKGSKYLTTRGLYEDNVKIVEHVGEGFVELVEAGELIGPRAETIVRRSVTPLLKAGADILVLGCTHYPFLSETIGKIAGPSVRIIDPAPAVARQTLCVMRDRDLLSLEMFDPSNHSIELLSSGDPASLYRIFSII